MILEKIKPSRKPNFYSSVDYQLSIVPATLHITYHQLRVTKNFQLEFKRKLVCDMVFLYFPKIPCYAFYLLWVNILGPWFFAAPPEIDEKQMKKMERKTKRQYVYK